MRPSTIWTLGLLICETPVGECRNVSNENYRIYDTLTVGDNYACT